MSEAISSPYQATVEEVVETPRAPEIKPQVENQVAGDMTEQERVFDWRDALSVASASVVSSALPTPATSVADPKEQQNNDPPVSPMSNLSGLSSLAPEPAYLARDQEQPDSPMSVLSGFSELSVQAPDVNVRYNMEGWGSEVQTPTQGFFNSGTIHRIDRIEQNFYSCCHDSHPVANGRPREVVKEVITEVVEESDATPQPRANPGEAEVDDVQMDDAQADAAQEEDAFAPADLPGMEATPEPARPAEQDDEPADVNVEEAPMTRSRARRAREQARRTAREGEPARAASAHASTPLTGMEAARELARRATRNDEPARASTARASTTSSNTPAPQELPRRAPQPGRQPDAIFRPRNSTQEDSQELADLVRAKQARVEARYRASQQNTPNEGASTPSNRGRSSSAVPETPDIAQFDDMLYGPGRTPESRTVKLPQSPSDPRDPGVAQFDHMLHSTPANIGIYTPEQVGSPSPSPAREERTANLNVAQEPALSAVVEEEEEEIPVPAPPNTEMVATFEDMVVDPSDREEDKIDEIDRVARRVANNRTIAEFDDMVVDPSDGEEDMIDEIDRAGRRVANNRKITQFDDMVVVKSDDDDVDMIDAIDKAARRAARSRAKASEVKTTAAVVEAVVTRDSASEAPTRSSAKGKRIRRAKKQASPEVKEEPVETRISLTRKRNAEDESKDELEARPVKRGRTSKPARSQQIPFETNLHKGIRLRFDEEDPRVKRMIERRAEREATQSTYW